MIGTPMYFKRSDILVHFTTVVAGNFLAFKVGPHVVLHVVLPLHDLVTLNTLEGRRVPGQVHFHDQLLQGLVGNTYHHTHHRHGYINLATYFSERVTL